MDLTRSLDAMTKAVGWFTRLSVLSMIRVRMKDTGGNAGEKERAPLKTAWVIEGVLGVLYRESSFQIKSSSERRIYTQAFEMILFRCIVIFLSVSRSYLLSLIYPPSTISPLGHISHSPTTFSRKLWLSQNCRARKSSLIIQ